MGAPSSNNTAAELESFRKVGNGIYLKRAAAGAPAPLDHPTLILTFGWMGAKLNHIFKYTTYHTQLYPEADQIIVTSEASFFWSSEETNRKQLAPLVEVLSAIGVLYPKYQTKESQQHHRILIHAFSNGGCTQLLCLSRVLSSLPSSIKLAPITSALVLDSTPGIGTFLHSYRAFWSLFAPRSRSFLSKLLIRPLYSIAVALLVSAIYLRLQPRLLFQRLFRGLKRSNALEYTERIVPGLASPILSTYSSHPRALTSADTPRLYIYSKADRVVPAYITAEHVREAKAKGNTDIREEVFEDTDHVMHARGDPERYWGAIQAVWKHAVQKTQLQAP